MPSAHTLDALPTPDDARVALRLAPEQRVAVVRFANGTSDATVRDRTEALRRWAAEHGLRVGGDAELNRYDPRGRRPSCGAMRCGWHWRADPRDAGASWGRG